MALTREMRTAVWNISEQLVHPVCSRYHEKLREEFISRVMIVPKEHALSKSVSAAFSAVVVEASMSVSFGCNCDKQGCVHLRLGAQ